MATLKNNNGTIDGFFGLASAYQAAFSIARNSGLTQLVMLDNEKIALVGPNGNELFFSSVYERLFSDVR